MLNSTYKSQTLHSLPHEQANVGIVLVRSYFNRDVDCIRRFFQRRFKYESAVYPKFTANLQNGKREFDLDVEVAASGFSKDDGKHLDDVRFSTCKPSRKGFRPLLMAFD